MNLQELTCRFQSLCHDGYSLSEVKAKIGGNEFNIKDVVFILETELLKKSVEVKLSETEEI